MTATKFLASLLATFVTLLVIWCAAGTAHAATYQETCRRVPLLQAARVGETVEVCELHRVPSVVRPSLTAKLDKDGTCGGLPATCCSWRTGSAALCSSHPTRRPGVTTVVHYGARPATYTVAYVR